MSDEIDFRTPCARCGHSWSFHGKTEGSQCRAMGCKDEQGRRCPGFVHAPKQSLSSAS